MGRWKASYRNAIRDALVAPALVLAIGFVAGSCALKPEPGEEEITRLVMDVLDAVKAGDAVRLGEFFVRDSRYEGPAPGEDPDAAGARTRLNQFCSAPEFDYDEPRPQIAVLRHRAVVTFDLVYRFRLRQERVEREMKVTLFIERRPEGWRILRDNISFPLEPHPDSGS